MNKRPIPHKVSHLKHPRSGTAGSAADQSWQRRFWMLLSLVAMFSAASIFFYTKSLHAETEEEVYVSVSVRTSISTDQTVICKLSLLVDPEQEKALQNRQKMLEAVVGDSLAASYQQDKYPKMADVKESLFVAINRKLPRKLQVQDVLIQELLVGMG